MLMELLDRIHGPALRSSNICDHRLQFTNQTGGQLNENPNESSEQQLTDGTGTKFATT